MTEDGCQLDGIIDSMDMSLSKLREIVRVREAWHAAVGHNLATECFPGSSAGKDLPAIQETLVRFLGQEDPPEKGKATHSSILGLPWWLRW